QRAARPHQGQRRQCRRAIPRTGAQDALRRDRAPADLRRRVAERGKGADRRRRRGNADAGAAGRPQLGFNTMSGSLTLSSWQTWALLSAVFAALTAVLAKVGVEDVNPDLATFIRTSVVLLSLGLLLIASGQFVWTKPVSPKAWLFLVLSGLAT